jgi:hypothetical protein
MQRGGCELRRLVFYRRFRTGLLDKWEYVARDRALTFTSPSGIARDTLWAPQPFIDVDGGGPLQAIDVARITIANLLSVFMWRPPRRPKLTPKEGVADVPYRFV